MLFVLVAGRVAGEQRAEQPAVDFGVEDRKPQPVARDDLYMTPSPRPKASRVRLCECARHRARARGQ
jgi:hypothetical protein